MAPFQERERTLPRLQRRHSIKGRFILLHFKFWRFKKAERHYISLFRELIRAVNQLSCHCIRIMPGTSNQSPGSKLALFRNLHSYQFYFYGFMLCQEPARRHLISLFLFSDKSRKPAFLSLYSYYSENQQSIFRVQISFIPCFEPRTSCLFGFTYRREPARRH